MNISDKERELILKIRQLSPREINKFLGMAELKLYENSLEKQNCKNELNILNFDFKKHK